jgi:putative hydrolase of the HAD superfamily
VIEWIGFDADDTLWHNETLFQLTQERFTELLSGYHRPEQIARRLYETETRNLKDLGYGVKAFTLSMIETAVELTEGRVSAREIGEILDMGRAMTRAPLQLLDHAEATVQQLGQRFPLLLITKGDIFDQESKIARSGLSRFFKGIEILTSKSAAAYAEVLSRYGIAPSSFLMVGNSLRSDVLPVLALGGRAVHVHYPLCWEHERVPAEEIAGRDFAAIASLAELPALLENLRSASGPSASPALDLPGSR